MASQLSRPANPVNGSKTVDEVRSFWERNPLWTGESQFPVGSREFFDEHRQVVIKDCLGGEFDTRTLPPPGNRTGVLDLGCGPGFWTVELALAGCREIVAADLTESALALARRRCELFGVAATFRRENAEQLGFEDGKFAHVNCQGVIHHTPDTEGCVREIARVLRPQGTATISVYYLSPFLRHWKLVRGVSSMAARFGLGLRGRGRESMLLQQDAQDVVRLYDGADNPIGKAYSRDEFRNMLTPHFDIRSLYLHFFPARALRIAVPAIVHRFLADRFGLMIYASVVKR
jgi:2-polyprenyl-3-methyl-5-hydroxy-6-metoxy-1,4-benzoquinol methylase